MVSKFRPWLKLSGVFIALSWHLGCLLVISAFKGKDMERGFRFRRKFCKSALAILDINLRHDGMTNVGVCLYVSNHRSMLDPLIQLAVIDAYIVSKAEVGSYPVIGKGAKETGIILVERENHNSRRAALDAIESALVSGCPVLIYPEGTTHGGDLTGEFKKGAFELARRNNIPIVPVMIEYPDAGYYWTDESLLDYFKRIFALAQKHQVIVRSGKPFQPVSDENILDRTQAEINSMILEARASMA